MQYWKNRSADSDFGTPWVPADLPESPALDATRESPLTNEDGTPYERPSDRGNRRPRTLPFPPRSERVYRQ